MHARFSRTEPRPASAAWKSSTARRFARLDTSTTHRASRVCGPRGRANLSPPGSRRSGVVFVDSIRASAKIYRDRAEPTVAAEEEKANDVE
jgi:hypothetical protein